ncbi:CopL family metal-binding regulatory protein [Steroidobacter sp. S1-65]|uniref:CopL family metal-binding regulatory protein n=1 Tax=Steroidobacter gossypii TaxID=2805490 RepID=A0ABS1WXM8_9GAMM|nr:CopL family metal-binding regulatory protein [Steroidobacter gossypii]
MTRLVMGELGHAMPVEGALTAPGHAMATGVNDPAQCHDANESGNASAQAHHGEHSQNYAGHSAGEQDCCETGECECPCLHVPCAALEAMAVGSIGATVPRILHGADGVISQRPSSLFRPPA